MAFVFCKEIVLFFVICLFFINLDCTFACNLGLVRLLKSDPFMTSQELHAKIQATKSFLNKELVKTQINPTNELLTFREIGSRLDMIHEAERIGVRNLGEHQNRKLTRMIDQLEKLKNVSLN